MANTRWNREFMTCWQGCGIKRCMEGRMCEEEEGGGGTLAGLVNYGEHTTHLGDHEVERELTVCRSCVTVH